MAVVDLLAASENWTFSAVATALHEFVVANDVSGVAAVLDRRPADPQGEPILFLFDQATAKVGENEFRGQGRSGWTTELVSHSPVEVRLSAAAGSVASPGTDLRQGVVEGAGASVPVDVDRVLPAMAPPLAAPAPTPPQAPVLPNPPPPARAEPSPTPAPTAAPPPVTTPSPMPPPRATSNEARPAVPYSGFPQPDAPLPAMPPPVFAPPAAMPPPPAFDPPTATPPPPSFTPPPPAFTPPPSFTPPPPTFTPPPPYEPPPYTPPPYEPPPLGLSAYEPPTNTPSSPGGPDWAAPVKGANVPDPFAAPPPPSDVVDPTQAWPTFDSPPPPPPSV